MNIGIVEIVVILALLCAMALWVIALVDCALHERGTSTDRIFWVLIILLGSFVGAIIYLRVRRPRRAAELAEAAREPVEEHPFG